MGVNNFENITVAVYATLLNLCGIAYFILLRVIKNSNKHNPHLLIPLQKQEKKGMISNVAYIVAIPIAFLNSGISAMIFVLVAIMWLVPDRNIEKSLVYFVVLQKPTIFLCL